MLSRQLELPGFFAPGCYYGIQVHSIFQGVMQMRCAWKDLLGILPLWMRQEVDRQGREDLQELRLRLDAPPELVTGHGIFRLTGKTGKQDLDFCINTASRYSPWSAATVSQGYITAPGGHRIGLCGEMVTREGGILSLREVTSLNIRVARDFPGAASALNFIDESTLILGAPGWGKTTLLRDLARQIAGTDTVAVVDERGELYPNGLERGKRMDVMTGCPKPAGIEVVLRSMGPAWIAMDEITAQSDASAMLQAVGCGVRLLATAHGTSVKDLRNRPIYKSLLECGIFHTLIILRRDKTYYTERICQ